MARRTTPTDRLASDAMRARQVRVEGPVPAEAASLLERSRDDDHPLWIDLRDMNGERIFHLPIQVVSVESDIDTPAEIRVDLVAMVETAHPDPPPPKTSESTLASASGGTSTGWMRPGGSPFGRANGKLVRDGDMRGRPTMKRRSRAQVMARDQEIARLRDMGMGLREIGLRMGLSESRVSKIANRVRYGTGKG